MIRVTVCRCRVLRRALLSILLIIVSSALTFSQSNGDSALETQGLDLKGCVHIRYPNKVVIRDAVTMRSQVRNDMSRDRCLELVKDLDFDKHTLVGTELNTGWCRYPLFTYRAMKEDSRKRYLIAVTYQPPDTPCRALSQYDLWILVPKLPEQYDVDFEVKEELPKK